MRSFNALAKMFGENYTKMEFTNHRNKLYYWKECKRQAGLKANIQGFKVKCSHYISEANEVKRTCVIFYHIKYIFNSSNSNSFLYLCTNLGKNN